MRHLKVQLFVFALSILLLPLEQLIQRGMSAEVAPAYAAIEIGSGGRGEFEITLKADADNEKVTAEAVDYTMDRAGAISTKIQDSLKYSARTWCQLKPTSIILEKDDPSKLVVPFRIPPGTPSGEYYLGIQVLNDTPSVISEGQTKTEIRVAAVILVVISVPGLAPKVRGDIIEEELEVVNHIPQFKATFKNTGTVSVISVMGVAIRKPDRTVMDYFLLKSAGSQTDDGQAFVLPEGLRDFSGGGNRKIPSGKYVAEISAVFGANNIRQMKKIDFEITGSDAEETSPIEDVIPSQIPFALEIAPGSINFSTLTFKNQGFNAVEVSLSSEYKDIKFLPSKIKIEAGKEMKVRSRVKVSDFEDVKRDIPIKLSLVGGGEEDHKDVILKLYAPGEAPSKEDKQGENNPDETTEVKEEKEVVNPVKEETPLTEAQPQETPQP